MYKHKFAYANYRGETEEEYNIGENNSKLTLPYYLVFMLQE